MTEVVAAPSVTAYVINATGETITSVSIGGSVIGQNLAPMTISAAPVCSMPGASFSYPSSAFTTTVEFSGGAIVSRTVQVAASGSAMVIVAMLNGLLVSTADGHARELLFTSGAAAVLLD
jgi:hypothetical protein